MRADTESLNAQFERAFCNRRLPAWGLHNQTVIVLIAALAQNAWARHTWQRAIDRQQCTATSGCLTPPPHFRRRTSLNRATYRLRATKSLPGTQSAVRPALKSAL